MPDVSLENVTKLYPPATVGVQNLNLHIEDGELLALVGPSGCGKTTLLRLIAGLEKPSSGTIRLCQRVVNDLPAAQRNLALVFQRPALYPQRTVADNIGFSLELQQGGWWRLLTATGRQKAKQRRQHVDGIARLLGLDGLLDRYPAQLSGGQQQRVALGRALVRQPGVLLLDEPLSNLDAGWRQDLRRELHLLQRQLHTTMVYVTHDPVEALSLGDRVAVMDRGQLLQVDRPQVLLHRPVNRFVAGFACWPPMNFVQGEIHCRNSSAIFAVDGECKVPVPSSRLEAWSQLTQRPLTLGIRPEDVHFVAEDTPGAWPMQVEIVEPLGLGALVSLTGPQTKLTAWAREDCQKPRAMDIMAGRNKVMVQLHLDNCHLFDRTTGAALAVRPAD